MPYTSSVLSGIGGSAPHTRGVNGRRGAFSLETPRTRQIDRIHYSLRYNSQILGKASAHSFFRTDFLDEERQFATIFPTFADAGAYFGGLRYTIPKSMHFRDGSVLYKDAKPSDD